MAGARIGKEVLRDQCSVMQSEDRNDRKCCAHLYVGEVFATNLVGGGDLVPGPCALLQIRNARLLGGCFVWAIHGLWIIVSKTKERGKRQ